MVRSLVCEQIREGILLKHGLDRIIWIVRALKGYLFVLWCFAVLAIDSCYWRRYWKDSERFNALHGTYKKFSIYGPDSTEGRVAKMQCTAWGSSPRQDVYQRHACINPPFDENVLVHLQKSYRGWAGDESLVFEAFTRMYSCYRNFQKSIIIKQLVRKKKRNQTVWIVLNDGRNYRINRPETWGRIWNKFLEI